MKRNDIYVDKASGVVIEVLHEGEGEISFNGSPMALQTANTVDAAQEKHVPVIEKTEKGYKIKIGSVAHPMLPEHYIEMIELVCLECGKVLRKYLKPGDAPEAEFCTNSKSFIAREYCNLHGLWIKEQK